MKKLAGLHQQYFCNEIISKKHKALRQFGQIYSFYRFSQKYMSKLTKIHSHPPLKYLSFRYPASII